MEITEVRIKLMEDSDDRLRAFCSVTFDDAFVVRDLKIIDGSNGPFVAMPSRKLTSHCGKCGSKNHLRASYCNNCGNRLKDERLNRDEDGRVKLYADIAHPINSECREMIQNRVIAEYEEELDRAQLPGYVSRYDDDYDDMGEEFDSGDFEEPVRRQPAATKAEPTPSKIAPDEETESDPETQSTEKPADTYSRRDEEGQSGPQPPHKRPTSRQNRSGRSDDDFGAGILD